MVSKKLEFPEILEVKFSLINSNISIFQHIICNPFFLDNPRMPTSFS